MSHHPNARPGTRAPHLWLADGRSLLDVFGEGYVLLRIGAAPPACDDVVAVARELRIPFEVFDLADGAGAEDLQQPLVLVRPDGHVAWRGPALPADLRGFLDTVRGGCPGGLKSCLRGKARRRFARREANHSPQPTEERPLCPASSGRPKRSPSSNANSGSDRT